MQITLVNSLYDEGSTGGAERSVRLLAEGLQRRGHNVSAVVGKAEGPVERKTVSGVVVYYVATHNIYWPFDADRGRRRWHERLTWHVLESVRLSSRPEWRAIFRRLNPDIVHTNNLYGISVAIWKTLTQIGLPVVHTLRDYYLLCPRSMFDGEENCAGQCLKCKPLSAPRKMVAQSVQGVVGISQFILREHVRHGFFANTGVKRVIPNAVRIPSKVDSRIKSSNDNGLRVGFIGRLVRRKGIEELLDVFVNDELPRMSLKVAGDGPEGFVDYLRGQYENERMSFVGYTDIESFYPSVDVLVVPSLWEEPFGRVVVEAFAYGVPVIVSSRGGLPELVEEGKTGFVFDPEEPDELRKLLSRLAHDRTLLRNLGSEALRRANAFKVERCVESYVEVYREVVEQSNQDQNRM